LDAAMADVNVAKRVALGVDEQQPLHLTETLELGHGTFSSSARNGAAGYAHDVICRDRRAL
jgi:hypothetical protein